MQLRYFIYLAILLAGTFFSCRSDTSSNSNTASKFNSAINRSNGFSNMSFLNNLSFKGSEYFLLFQDGDHLNQMRFTSSSDGISWKTFKNMELPKTGLTTTTYSLINILPEAVVKDSSYSNRSQIFCYADGKGNILIGAKKQKGLTADYFKAVTGIKTFWHDQSKHWVMMMSLKDNILFYRSPDMEAWEFVSNFGEKDGYHGQAGWHSPDLFEMDANGSSLRKKWVLMVSSDDGHPTKLGGTQYFVGDFNGKVFINNNLFSKVLWLDWGADNISAQSAFNTNTENREMIGCMNSNKYASNNEIAKGKSGLTIPRKLDLKDTFYGYKLFATPTKSFERRRGSKISQKTTRLSDEANALKTSFRGPTEFFLEFSQKSNEGYTIEFSNEKGESFTFGYNGIRKMYLLNRMNVVKGVVPDPLNEIEHFAPRFSTLPKINVRIIIDNNKVEVFADDGLTVFSELIYPTTPLSQMKIWGTTGQISMDKMDMYQLK